MSRIPTKQGRLALFSFVFCSFHHLYLIPQPSQHQKTLRDISATYGPGDSHQLVLRLSWCWCRQRGLNLENKCWMGFIWLIKLKWWFLRKVFVINITNEKSEHNEKNLLIKICIVDIWQVWNTNNKTHFYASFMRICTWEFLFHKSRCVKVDIVS